MDKFKEYIMAQVKMFNGTHYVGRWILNDDNDVGPGLDHMIEDLEDLKTLVSVYRERKDAQANRRED